MRSTKNQTSLVLEYEKVYLYFERYLFLTPIGRAYVDLNLFKCITSFSGGQREKHGEFSYIFTTCGYITELMILRQKDFKIKVTQFHSEKDV
jgi:hypothetical protein